MTNPIIFNQILIWPILNVLIAFYKLFSILKIPGAFGWAIIGLTIFIRLLLSPIFTSQLKSAQKMQELKPKLDELSKRYNKDKARLQQEQLKLYRETGVNPAAGCLPLLLQMPIFIALYNVFWQILGNGNLGKIVQDINQVVYFPFLQIQTLDFSFFGINLALKPSSWQTQGWWLLIIPLVTAILQWYQTKLMMPSHAPAKGGASEGKPPPDKDDMSKIMQGQMSFLFPLMIGWFAFSFPVGLSLYWNTFSAFSIIQQRRMKPVQS